MARRPTGHVVETKRKGGRVFALRFHAYGKRRFVTLGWADEGWSRKRAELELENVLADVRRGIWREPQPVSPDPEPQPEPTFHEFSSEWFAARRAGWSESTRNDYGWQLSNHLLPYFAGHPLSTVTVAEVDRYRDRKAAEGTLSVTSVNKTIGRLSQILGVAVEYGLIDRNPARGPRRRLKASKPRRTWLDRAEQIQALLNAAGELDAEARSGDLRHRRALLATLTFAGLRLGELLAMRWDHVDLAGGRLRIPDAKTDAGVRYVDLLPVLRDELAAYKARCREAIGTGFVFSTSTRRAHGQTNVRRRVLARAVSRANEHQAAKGLAPLPEGLTPHSLRRTFASLRLAIGDEVPYVMQQLGHVDPKVTLGIYAQVMFRKDGERERLRRLVEGDNDLDSAQNHSQPQLGQRRRNGVR